jgi:hypothetical protein
VAAMSLILNQRKFDREDRSNEWKKNAQRK